MTTLTQPEFISRNVDQIVREMIAYYEGETGKTLQPAQPERLLINAFAYREGLVRQAIQDAAVQNLVDFSSAPVLDYLGQLVGVTRLPGAPASVTVRFTFVNGYSAFTIPSGTRVQTNDGRVVFSVIEDADADGVVTHLDVDCECEVSGALGNGYLAGTITVLLDSLGAVESVSNTNESAAGSDEETDANLRDRIKLAPASFSTAGSRGAYVFHARSAHPSIIDVAVVSTTPGKVEIYPLVKGGIPTPTPVLDAVRAACTGEKVRPLTDTVVVDYPHARGYNIYVNLRIYSWANADEVVANVKAALTEFAQNKVLKMGQDILKSMVIGVVMKVDGVYDCDPRDGFFSGGGFEYDWQDGILSQIQFPLLGFIDAQVIETVDG